MKRDTRKVIVIDWTRPLITYTRPFWVWALENLMKAGSWLFYDEGGGVKMWRPTISIGKFHNATAIYKCVATGDLKQELGEAKG